MMNRAALLYAALFPLGLQCTVMVLDPKGASYGPQGSCKTLRNNQRKSAISAAKIYCSLANPVRYQNRSNGVSPRQDALFRMGRYFLKTFFSSSVTRAAGSVLIFFSSCPTI